MQVLEEMKQPQTWNRNQSTMRHLRVQCHTLQALPRRLSPSLIRPRVSNCRCGLAVGHRARTLRSRGGHLRHASVPQDRYCSIPLHDVPRLVAQRTTAKEKPAKFAVGASEAAFHFVRLYRVQSFPECFQNSRQVVRMNRSLPSRVQSLLCR